MDQSTGRPRGVRTTCRVRPDCTERPPSSRWRCSPLRGPPASQAWASTRRAPTPTARGTLPDGTVLPTAAIEAPASVGDARQPRRRAHPRLRQRHPAGRAVGLPARRGRDQRGRQGLQPPVGADRRDRPRRVRPRPLRRQLPRRPAASPAPASTASRSTARTTPSGSLDTDAGQYDNDTRFDRAVGPMQFIPSTWSVVGVDGDSDGTRNPQDIDDAALATAVYLCSGDDDLSPRRASGPRSTATTTPTTTSTWCWRSCRPTWTATSAPCRPRRSPPA